MIGEDFVEKDGQFAAANESRCVLGDNGGAGARGRGREERPDGAEGTEDALGVGGAEEEEIDRGHDLTDGLFNVGQLGLKTSYGDGVVEKDGGQCNVTTWTGRGESKYKTSAVYQQRRVTKSDRTMLFDLTSIDASSYLFRGSSDRRRSVTRFKS